MHTSVLIVDAGPVGLTLAIDLGLRGIKCTLVEQKEAPQFLPKMERCNARTMERHYRVADDRSTFLIVQDDTKHFTLHSVVEQDRRAIVEPDMGKADATPSARAARLRAERRFATLDRQETIIG
ncbi:MAG: FAD-dependent monooxygenase [Xanthobacteraceae bacterium]